MGESAVAGQTGLLRDPVWLAQRYQDDGLTSREIAALIGSINESTVNRALSRYGIPRRTPGTRRSPPLGRLADGDWLREQYLQAGLTCRQIGQVEGVSEKVVRRALDWHGVDVRSRKARRAAAAANPRLADAAWLRSRYVHDELDIRQIADLAGASTSTVHKALARAGIPRRPRTSGIGRPEYARLHDATWLRRQHLELGLTNRQIAELLGCGPSTVSHALRQVPQADRELSYIWRLHRADQLEPQHALPTSPGWQPTDWVRFQDTVCDFVTARLRAEPPDDAQTRAVHRLSAEATSVLSSLDSSDDLRPALRLLLLAQMATARAALDQ